MRFGRRAYYRAIIRGLDSGNVSQLPWLTFATEEEAQIWVRRMNDAKSKHDPDPPLTAYDYEVIDE